MTLTPDGLYGMLPRLHPNREDYEAHLRERARALRDFRRQAKRGLTVQGLECWPAADGVRHLARNDAGRGCITDVEGWPLFGWWRDGALEIDGGDRYNALGNPLGTK